MKILRYLFTQYLIFLGAVTISSLIFPLKTVDKFVIPVILIGVSYFAGKVKKKGQVS